MLCTSEGVNDKHAYPRWPHRKRNEEIAEYLKYGFVQSPSNPRQLLCLICEKTFTNEVKKPSKLIKHLNRMHGDKAGKDLSYFQSLRDSFKKRPRLSSFFSFASSQSSDGLRDSYILSLTTAKSGKPHTIGEQLLLPAMSEVLRTVLHMPATNNQENPLQQ
ncbi:LOW QUALITY PROTEIN: hypothetical protein M514_27423, partial [Trichuris suis]